MNGWEVYQQRALTVNKILGVGSSANYITELTITW